MLLPSHLLACHTADTSPPFLGRFPCPHHLQERSYPIHVPTGRTYYERRNALRAFKYTVMRARRAAIAGQFRAELIQTITAAQGEKVAPEHKELVSVYFSDIVGFTSISATISSAKV
jgi:hypothetical protein